MRAPESPTVVAVRIVAGVLGGGAAVLWLLLAATVLSSRFDTNPAHDPHGFGLMFGTLLAMPVGVIWAVALPFAAPRQRWGPAAALVLTVFVAGSVGLLAALFTAH